VMESLPLNANGKVDRAALPTPGMQQIVREVWESVLGIQSLDLDTPFFDLGGTSLQMLQVQGYLAKRIETEISLPDLFRFPTIRSLGGFLSKQTPSSEAPRANTNSRDIAIVGMAGRFPGATNIAQFWNNLKNGVESITTFTDAELEFGQGPNTVKSRPILDDADMFDAAYFGILPKEAETMDPQHRFFLETCVEALEDAGCDPARFGGEIGVFAGCSPNTYFLRNLCADRAFIEDYTGQYQVGNYMTMLGTSPDFLATRVSYKLNLTGPSITMGTACSTSLVAVTQACDSLIGGHCDAALAGGVSITFPQNRGYQSQEGGLASADGHCRAFDADAQGTVFGSGCAVVLLKRLEDAVRDGDSIYAVIKGYGINNDGAGKVGFTAPSVEGQAAAIRKAQRMAGVEADSITYVEAHGTATPLGDPIEIAGLTEAFRASTNAKQFCAIGTGKTNVGHLDAAAGVTGLIKTALSVREGVLPPTLHYRKPNPRIDFANSPFYVNDTLANWNPAGMPRRAGVSSFGVGGTNAHVILEEAPQACCAEPQQEHYLHLLSAKSPTALQEATARLDAHLKSNPEIDLGDVAYTLHAGRRRFEHRAFAINGNLDRVVTGRCERELPVVFAFPGQGSQYSGMGMGLYESLPVFRAAIDEASAILKPADILAENLNQTEFAQPAIFALEYALAKQWMSWGVQPQAMVGHSVGEFVAACLADVFSLEDALTLVAERGRMMQQLPTGAMLSVRASEEHLKAFLTPELSLAAVNSPMLCVAAGSHEAIGDLEMRLTRQGIACKKLRTSHAFHSAMVESIVEPLTRRIRAMRLSAPRIPYVSTLTGTWITEAQATNPEYWGRHCRETVQFSPAVKCLKADREWCVLEVGPGQALSTLVRQHEMTAVASLPEATQPEFASMLSAAGRLWLCGHELEMNTRGRRISLPTYPFERKRFWIEPVTATKKLEGPVLMNTVVEPVASPARKERLCNELAALLEDLSGMEVVSAGPQATFLDLGFDSLFLTQVTQAVETKYGAKIRFARLLDDLNSIDLLAAHLDSTLTQEVEPVKAAPAPPVASAPMTGATNLDQLLQQQLQAFAELTARQLEVFGRTNSAAPKAPETPAPAGVPAPQKFEAFGPYKPVNKGVTGGLSEAQSRYLENFTQRYNNRTKESKRMTQQHRATLADPRVASGFRSQWKDLVYPIHMVRSNGSKMWDVDGNEYIDLLNGFGVTMFGHCPEFVRQAVATQLDLGFEIGPQTPLAGKVAELVCELTGMERATFCNTGSEAVMAAIRLARTVTNKKKVVFFAGDYHGSFDEVLVKAAGKRSRPIAPGIPDDNVANIMVLEYGSPAALETIRQHAHELAAVMVEPVQSRHPNLQPIEFLRELRTITEQSNVALIFDEVVTGFRTHPGGAQALFGIRADLASYGKVIGGGMPVGVLAGSSKYMDALDGGAWKYGDDSFPEVGVTFFAGTFVRHPLAMAATWAVLNHLKTAGPQLQEDLSEKTGRLVRALNELFEQGSVPARVENFRSIFYFGFPSDQRFASLLYYHLRAKGVHIQEGFPCFLTTAHTEEDLDQVIRAFRESIAEMQQAGFFPASPARFATIEYEAPLTEAQMEIRLSAQLGDEESCSYNEGFTLTLTGPLNPSALRDSLVGVINRHEALRSTLTESGDALRILPRIDFAMPTLDLSNLNESEQRARVEQIMEEDCRIAFDLLNGPLIRAVLVRLSGDRHLLLITAHHIICDGWSTNIILEELSQLYSGKNNLSEPLRFSEYAHAQALQNVEPDVENYWVSEYSEPVAPLELPLDRPRPALKSYRGATYVAQIEAASYQRIKKAGAQRGATLFATMLTGFQALLARLTGQSDIVVGIPAAAQSALSGQILVGHCVNFLPIRAKVNADEKFSDVLSRSRRKLLDAYDHQSYTYGTLVRKLAIPRNPSRLPLIEVQFNLERVGSKLEFPGLDVSVAQCGKRFVNFDLFVNAVESPEGLTLYCDYNTDLFDESTIARWLGHYKALLSGFAVNADLPISSLPLLSETDRNTMLNEWNATATEYPKNKCVQDMIEERAVATPNTVAVRCGADKLTYAELSRKSNQFAHWLQASGVGRESLVGISIEPSIEMLLAVLGVLKAGGAYVPLDPNYPQDRLDFIRQDAHLSLVLTSENWPNLDKQPTTPLTPVPATQLAYVMYTSGSTGKPKGVEISHQALMSFLCSMRRQPGLSSTDKLLAVTTLSFDIAGLEIFLPLTTGAEVIIADRDTARDGVRLMSLMQTTGATVMQATPTTWKLLLEAGWTGNANLKVLCGGEELTRELANQLVPRCAALWNMYGPTETTIWSSTCRVFESEGPVSIGCPIANTQMYVLDPQGQPVPVGVPGELYIGGDGLARGYLNRAELTAERFVCNPFVNDSNARMYRTGDLARYLPDGQIICLGRLDNQVKIRGHRIELGEIESALLAQPTVRDAAVIVREDSPGDKRLVAYVIPRSKLAANLRDSLANRLPAYMIPALILEMEALPLTPNGKIDRRALGTRSTPTMPVSDKFVAPRTDNEKLIASIWQEVLRVERVGVDDDLFTLGADSIHLFQIASRAAKQGLAVTPKQLLQYRTVAEVSAVIDRGAAPKPVAAAQIKPVSRDSFRLKRVN
jgi:amino acid adenylation domain-containing protein